MIRYASFAIVYLVVGSPVSATDVVARAEHTELKLSNGTVVPRVVRDSDGQVTRLLLNDMNLSPEEFVELGQLQGLRELVLLGTNVSDENLLHLKNCPQLGHLNLVRTEVSDRAVDTILQLKQLKSLCLGDVKITPQAIERLRVRNRQSDSTRQLRWGYSQRKP